MSRSGSLGAYYLLGEGFVKNSNYASVSEFKSLEPVNLKELGLFSGEDIYDLMSNHDKLEFFWNLMPFLVYLMQFLFIIMAWSVIKEYIN